MEFDWVGIFEGRTAYNFLVYGDTCLSKKVSAEDAWVVHGAPQLDDWIYIVMMYHPELNRNPRIANPLKKGQMSISKSESAWWNQTEFYRTTVDTAAVEQSLYSIGGWSIPATTICSSAPETQQTGNAQSLTRANRESCCWCCLWSWNGNAYTIFQT